MEISSTIKSYILSELAFKTPESKLNEYNLLDVHDSSGGIAVACWTTDHYHPCSTSAWAYMKVVSSLTSPHYLWRSLGPFSLPLNVSLDY
jgi:hypothetical protein